MFKNYLKTARRNITRTIGYSILNVPGLATKQDFDAMKKLFEKRIFE